MRIVNEEEPISSDCDKTFGGEVNKRKTERGITKTVKENNMSVVLVREQVGDANSY